MERLEQHSSSDLDLAISYKTHSQSHWQCAGYNGWRRCTLSTRNRSLVLVGIIKLGPWIYSLKEHLHSFGHIDSKSARLCIACESCDFNRAIPCLAKTVWEYTMLPSDSLCYSASWQNHLGCLIPASCLLLQQSIAFFSFPCQSIGFSVSRGLCRAIGPAAIASDQDEPPLNELAKPNADIFL